MDWGARITYNAIRKYFIKVKELFPILSLNGATCVLVRMKTGDGKYRVVASIFFNSSKLESRTWEGKELDRKLQSEFGQKNRIIYDLRSMDLAFKNLPSSQWKTKKTVKQDVGDNGVLNPIIEAIRKAIAALKTIFTKFLSWLRILGWFRKKEPVKNSDPDNLALTLQEKLNNGKFSTVMGIFNARTGELVDGEVISSEQIDPQLAEVHRNNELVVYE
jgi:hypothetical protein